MQPLMIAGLTLIGISLLVFLALCFVKRDPPPPPMNTNPIVYRSNSMKRNKSDTDLELMHSQEESTV